MLHAALVPELLVQARRITNTVMAGWHGRKKRGIGETFWQHRPYAQGETLARIDWRRSARDDQTYVRDMEWEAAHTIWLWVDKSPSMLFKSEQANVSKQSRSLVIAFALAELFSRGGERIGYPGLLKPAASRNGAERLAATVLGQLSSLLIVISYVAVATSLVWIALKETIGLRVTSVTEARGIDQTDFVLGN